MGRKQDIKEVERIARKHDMTAEQRRDFETSSLNTTADFALVPTLRVGMPSRTLRVLFRAIGRHDRRRGASKTAFPRGAWNEKDVTSNPWWCSASSLGISAIISRNASRGGDVGTKKRPG